MDISKLSRLNLNLLATLLALLQERHAGDAAKRLNISQSAVSKNLTKLRELFKDPLFHRSTQGLLPTPLALELEPQIVEIIKRVENLFSSQEFTPDLFEGCFRLAMQDTGFVFVTPELLKLCQDQAPGMIFDFWLKDEKGLQELLLGEIDLLILPQDLGQHWQNDSKLVHRELYREPLACLLRKGHPALNMPWNEETYLKFAHVGVRDEQFGASMLDRTLAVDKRARNITTVVPDFRSATRLCEASDAIFTCSHSWADLAVKEKGLVGKPLPIGDFICTYHLVWHQRVDTSPAYKWLRERIFEISDDLIKIYKLADLTEQAVRHTR